MRKDRSLPLSREGWIEAALGLLAERGSEAVKVEPLARRLGVTKGSFYWHFRDRRELLEAALRRWQESATLEVRDTVEAGGGSAAERLRRLFTVALQRRSMGLETALRGWAARDRVALQAVERVDGLRLAYLRDLYVAAGLREPEAEARGFVAYALLFGESLIRIPRNAQRRASLMARCAELLLGALPADAGSGSGRQRGGRRR